ncbi:hypothetical protein CC85DRAFT_303511 [Cutaneotrichosporon oleaginosum]|uniref:Uncharacterized protein n=1 Tax=Cutaneotrichosporon oleaginosum TaxID=879819 RepID=A0A0J0XJ27_9TREE|nr:uncharacterized protein CC85DRAFT_303511 [Cutaneotrichosporon oleaginosum]KLT41068.1 hypothetical protein CC85DRAFT_303511 [Cutaneotrichosporon oleaginosum]TXT05797.1 hypothetical protein COLE_07117 [Cutaneotrichosporon oleaginosum]
MTPPPLPVQTWYLTSPVNPYDGSLHGFIKFGQVNQLKGPNTNFRDVENEDILSTIDDQLKSITLSLEPPRAHSPTPIKAQESIPLLGYLAGQAFLACFGPTAVASPWPGPMEHVMPTPAAARLGDPDRDRNLDHEDHPSTPTPAFRRVARRFMSKEKLAK